MGVWRIFKMCFYQAFFVARADMRSSACWVRAAMFVVRKEICGVAGEVKKRGDAPHLF
jgi:hypothetical protein